MKLKPLFNILFIIFGVILLGASTQHDKLAQQEAEQKRNEQVLAENINETTSEVFQDNSITKSKKDSNSDKTNSAKTKSGKEDSKENRFNTTDPILDYIDSLDNTKYTNPNAYNDNLGLPKYATLYPDLYVRCSVPDKVDNGKKVAYLTFDDGPSKITGEILDVLKDQDVKATFFIIGSAITEKRLKYLKTMVERGYTIGIHTYSHKDDIYDSVDSYLEDFNKAFLQIYELTGIKPTIFRFPYGSINSYNKRIKYELIAEMERRGFTYYDWNVSAEDSCGNPSESKIMSNVLDHFQSFCKPVILMHDSSINGRTAKTLPIIIKKIKESGYEFDTVDNRAPCQFYFHRK